MKHSSCEILESQFREGLSVDETGPLYSHLPANDRVQWLGNPERWWHEQAVCMPWRSTAWTVHVFVYFTHSMLATWKYLIVQVLQLTIACHAVCAEREALLLNLPRTGVGGWVGADEGEDIMSPTHFPTHFLQKLEGATACQRRDAAIGGPGLSHGCTCNGGRQNIQADSNNWWSYSDTIQFRMLSAP